jgi:glycerol-3-phosphate O-acyltransferase/dihydroxyacetone phosphate acyltransferase
VRSHKAPIRRVIRHVIRARAEAVRALTEFMAQLGGPSADQRWVHAAPHLAALYGGRVENLAPAENEVEGGPPDADRRGWRTAREVLDFLASRGAKVETLKRPIEGEWIAQDGSEDSGREDGELRRRR